MAHENLFGNIGALHSTTWEWNQKAPDKLSNGTRRPLISLQSVTCATFTLSLSSVGSAVRGGPLILAIIVVMTLTDSTSGDKRPTT